MRFNGKQVLVTGAASGIGLATAKRFIAEGATVTATDIDADLLNQRAGELGEKYIPKVCDAGSVSDIAALFESIDKLDVLVNNAGIGIIRDPEEMSEADYDKQIQILLKGPTFHVKHAAAKLRESNGCVVNISSASAMISLHGYTAYAPAKEALVKFTKDCVVTVPGMRHNVILPGLIDTPILEKAYGEEGVAMLQGLQPIIPAQRLGQPDDIASAVLFLASDDASYMNGSELLVDGGLTKMHVMSMPPQE